MCQFPYAAAEVLEFVSRNLRADSVRLLDITRTGGFQRRKR